MKKNDIFVELQGIFRTVFNNNRIEISETSKAADIDDWDSLNHAALISAIEGHFGIRFKLTELMDLNDVGTIVEAIEGKLGQR